MYERGLDVNFENSGGLKEKNGKVPGGSKNFDFPEKSNGKFQGSVESFYGIPGGTVSENGYPQQGGGWRETDIYV